MAPRAPRTTEKKPARAAKAKAVAEVAGDATAIALTTPDPGAGGALKLKELIESVAAKTGGKKPEVKAAVEATLAALGEALATGKALAVPPLGKLRVVKNKGSALTLKLRLAGGAKAAGLALADDGEDG